MSSPRSILALAAGAALFLRFGLVVPPGPGETGLNLYGVVSIFIWINLMLGGCAVVLMVLVLGLSVLGHVREEHAARVDLLSWYWHFVDVVWIAVFTVVYVVGV